jgi:hypothetical protein
MPHARLAVSRVQISQSAAQPLNYFLNNNASDYSQFPAKVALVYNEAEYFLRNCTADCMHEKIKERHMHAFFLIS